MELFVKEQIRVLLAQENIKLKELAQLYSKETGKQCSADCLSHKIRLGTLRYNDVVLIAKILGYNIKFEKNK